MSFLCLFQTKKSTWYKPECFQTKKERANLTDWKELHTSEGRKYYYNITTKETTWIMPAQLKEIIERMVIDREKQFKKKQEKKGIQKIQVSIVIHHLSS